MVLLISDGLDRDVAVGLEQEAERLHKSCRRFIWLNPLLRYDGFAPHAAGMRALLPHVDDFKSIHNLASLEELCALLSSESEYRGPRAGEKSWMPAPHKRGQHGRTAN